MTIMTTLDKSSKLLEKYISARSVTRIKSQFKFYSLRPREIYALRDKTNFEANYQNLNFKIFRSLIETGLISSKCIIPVAYYNSLTCNIVTVCARNTVIF